MVAMAEKRVRKDQQGSRLSFIVTISLQLSFPKPEDYF